MYRKRNREQLQFEEFTLPFGGRLRSDNRWVRYAKQIPWEEIEQIYCELFSKDKGAPAKPLRIALGALIIKERLSITDEETVEQIRENPYLQYFIGLEEYRDEEPFDASMMVHFRKRLGAQVIGQINDLIVNRELKVDKKADDTDKDNNEPGTGDESKNESSEKTQETPNSGVLMTDASVAPADITYPTDLKLLNEARENLEKIIDALYESTGDAMKKPRTYRIRARKNFLNATKLRRKSEKTIRKALKKQLQYVKRDLKHIENLKKHVSLSVLKNSQYKKLLVINELYRQQKKMFQERTNSVEDRIVNISQPHVRPIVRGKDAASTEFGAKIVVSRINGYDVIEQISWDNFNESTMLQKQIERYKERMGCYPEAVLADKIYRTRANRDYCKQHNIRLSGPKLGRPSTNRKEEKKIESRDSAARNAIEGCFGVGKRKYALGRIMMKLAQTSESSIALVILIMNLEKIVRIILLTFLRRLFLCPIMRF